MSVYTDRIWSAREGNVLTHVCPSICLSTPRGVPEPDPCGGGTPAQIQVGVPPAGGTPPQVPPHVKPGQGSTLTGRVPHLEYPPSDLEGVSWQEVPHLRYPPVRPGWRVPWQRRYPTSGTPLSDLGGGTLMGGTLPQVPLIRPGEGNTLTGGYPTLGTPVRPVWGGTLMGVPHLGYPSPPSDLDGRVLWWVVPRWGIPQWGSPIRPGWGVPRWGGYPTLVNRWSIDKRQSLCLLCSCRSTFLFNISHLLKRMSWDICKFLNYIPHAINE